ncbi:MAG: hypothetical protein QXY45_04360, partial [Candidatus Aenigmatarchaeota archaeon]
KFYNKSKNWKEFKADFLKFGIKRRTWFQETGGITISILASFLVRSPIPLISNITHCSLDWLTNYDSVPLAPFYNGIKTRGFIKVGDLLEMIIEFSFIIGLLI